jgi:HPt (histidine-containing phosphotransfer) domain-containing protein
MTIKTKLLILSDHKRLVSGFMKVSSPRFDCLQATSALIAKNLLEMCIDDIAAILCDESFASSIFSPELKVELNKFQDISLFLISNKRLSAGTLSQIQCKTIASVRTSISPKTLMARVCSVVKDREDTIEQRIVVENCFFEESQEIYSALKEKVGVLRERMDDKDAIITIHRLAHTFKGSSAIAGFEGISAYAKRFEAMMNTLKNDPSMISSELVDVMLKAADVLIQMVEYTKQKKTWTQSLDEMVKIFMIEAPKPPIEAARQAAVDFLRLERPQLDRQFDELTELASIIFKVPISLVSIIDKDRQWFKGQIGLDLDQTSRKVSFCGHAILQSDVFIVEDARVDPRFAGNPLVTGAPNVVFYAGCPLITHGGQAIGTLCLIDHMPRRLSDDEVKALKILARQVMLMMELSLASERQAA